MTTSETFPNKARETTVAIPLAMTIEVKLATSKEERRTISVAKKTPARGALKVAATPAAAPQATRTLIRSPLILNILPNWLPMVPPITAIGPSCPALPPVPKVIAEANPLVNNGRNGNFAPCKLTRTRKVANPPLRSLANNIHNGITSNPPIAGINNTRARFADHSSSEISSRFKLCSNTTQ